jgi:putative transposase
MLASRRTWWRIAEAIIDQSQRPLVPTRAGTRTPRVKPVLVATRPGQVWSWDITDVQVDLAVGLTYKAYSIIDIFSRKIVGYRVEAREVDDLAVEMFETAIAEFGAPEYVHADSGAAMKSHALKNALEAHGVEMSHNRPYVSNDNPYSESEFRTMKYRPGLSGRRLNHSRPPEPISMTMWCGTTPNIGIPGSRCSPPNQVHDGSWEEAYGTAKEPAPNGGVLRETSRNVSVQHHRSPMPAGVVGINHELATSRSPTNNR